MKPVKNKKYLAFIGQRDCQLTGTSFEMCVVHHVTVNSGKGVSQKPSDYRCISLKADLHQLLHLTGESLWWEQQGVNPFEYIVSNLEAWIVR